MDEYPTEKQLKALRVVDLKQKLTEIGLPTGGLKADLIARLHAYYQEQASQVAEGNEEAVEDEGNEAAEGGNEDHEEVEEVEDKEEEQESPMDIAEPAEERNDSVEEQPPTEELSTASPPTTQDEASADVSETSRGFTYEDESSQENPEQVEESNQEEQVEETSQDAPQQLESSLNTPQQVEETSQETPQQFEETSLDTPQQGEASNDGSAVGQTNVPEEEEESRDNVQDESSVSQPFRDEDSVSQPFRDDDSESQPWQRDDFSSQDEESVTLFSQEDFSQIPQLQEAQEAAAKSVTVPKFSIPIPKQAQVQRSMRMDVDEGDDLEGPSTPAGPIQQKKGPVPLMSLMVQPPPNVDEMANLPEGEMPKLPQALEEALAFKTERARQVGVNPADIERFESEGIDTEDDEVSVERPRKPNQSLQSLISIDDDDRKDKGKRQHKKKKKKKRNRPEEWARQAAEAERRKLEEEERQKEPDVEVEYVQDKLDLDPSDPIYRQFAKIFEAFKIQEGGDDAKDEVKDEVPQDPEEFKKVPKLLEEDDLLEEKEEEDDSKPKLSKRKLKKLNRLSVAELKQLVHRPDVVEMHDVTARDPRILVHLKSTRNTVPVPRHWCFKRKYLQGKRGIEKPPFDLPDFIKKTGIMEMRAALQEKEEAKGLKAKMREKVRPKLGKIDIDYQKLHDAFFKWQTKPRMTLHGDLYYEGKEYEIRLKEKKPGDLSDDLRTALGMPVGPNAHKVPPPWLIAMQRYGPPPSYPNLKIPGLNAPIPDGCSFGYHAGGWGKPPVDETGKPLYGDVFGTADSAYLQQMPPEEIDRSLWGELESESEEEESEEESEEEEEAAEADPSGMQTPTVDAGLATPSGISSVGAPGQETPELLELRKRRIEADMEGGETPNLYTILPEKRPDRGVGAAMMGSTHTYDVNAATATKRLSDTGGVELALNPEEVDLMDTDAMQARAEAALREQQASLSKEDLSDMVAEHAAKQSNKRKRMAGGKEEKQAKKYKEFKF